MSLYLEIYSMYAWGYICSYMNKLSQVKIFFREKILTFLDKKAIIFYFTLNTFHFFIIILVYQYTDHN